MLTNKIKKKTALILNIKIPQMLLLIQHNSCNYYFFRFMKKQQKKRRNSYKQMHGGNCNPNVFNKDICNLYYWLLSRFLIALHTEK